MIWSSYRSGQHWWCIVFMIISNVQRVTWGLDWVGTCSQCLEGCLFLVLSSGHIIIWYQKVSGTSFADDNLTPFQTYSLTRSTSVEAPWFSVLPLLPTLGSYFLVPFIAIKPALPSHPSLEIICHWLIWLLAKIAVLDCIYGENWGNAHALLMR